LVNCLKGPILQLVALLLLASAVQFTILTYGKDYPLLYTFASRHILFGNDDWIMADLVLSTFGLGIGLTSVIWLAISIIVFFISIPIRLFPGQGNRKSASVRQFAIHLTVSVGLLAFIPSSILFTIYFILWLLMTASARLSARSDLPSFQNVYNYRLSWLIFLTSLLPYYIPSVIAYIKDIIIGCIHHTISPITLVQDVPVLLILIYLLTLGKSPDVLPTK
jgi:hypothetical protein